MNASAFAAASRGTDVSNIAGARRLNRSAVAAALRLWTSSPMLSACAISGISSMPPVRASVARKRRREVARDPAQAIDHLGSVGAEAQHLAEPFVEVAVRAVAVRLFSTTQSGIDGLMMPAIGPTAP